MSANHTWIGSAAIALGLSTLGCGFVTVQTSSSSSGSAQHQPAQYEHQPQYQQESSNSRSSQQAYQQPYQQQPASAVAHRSQGTRNGGTTPHAAPAGQGRSSRVN